MKVLAFDVTAARLTVGLADGGKVLGRWDAPANRDRGNSLDRLIDEALAQVGWSRAVVEGLALVTGPGSLTATRIGWATASGWASAKGIPVTGWPTPEVQRRWWRDHDLEGHRLERTASGSEVAIYCMVHHRGDEFYCYELNGDQNKVAPPSIAAIGAWQPPTSNACWVVGPGVLGYRPRWAAELGDRAQLVSDAHALVGGDQLAQWAVRDLISNKQFSLSHSPLDYGLPPTFRKAS